MGRFNSRYKFVIPEPMAIVRAAVSTLLWALCLPFFCLHPKMRGPLAQRLGSYPTFLPTGPQCPRIWLHGASAGDVLALAPTARALRAKSPSCTLIVTTLTASGVAMAQQQGALFDAVLLSPLDTPWTVRRALTRIKPTLLVLEYTELWPQLIACTQARHIPIALHNGRFGSGRLWRYRLLFALTGNLLRHLDLLLMRDPIQAARAQTLGAKAAQIVTTGNTKFDNLHGAPNSALIARLQHLLSLTPSEQLLIYGSTHEGEEEPLLNIFVALRRQLPHLRLVIAPRYTERAERIRALCLRHGLTVALRSKLSVATTAQVLLLDSVGELSACYLLAAVTFVGGSFVARGGQNILEPAALGKAVVFGPHMSNFADAVAVLTGRGGVQVQNYGQLQRVLQDLLHDPDMAKELGRTAQQQVRAVTGAADRNAAHLLRLAVRDEACS